MVNTMKRFGILLALILLAVPSAFSQSKEAMKKIESARIALITERLNLTPEQAEKFWPIYREFNEKRRMLRQELASTRKNVDPATLTEQEGKQLMAKTIAIKQQELNLEQEYSNRMLNVISTQQMLRLRNAEKDFQDMLLRRLQEQRGREIQKQKMIERRDMLNNKQNN